jgi:hypothetical protein
MAEQKGREIEQISDEEARAHLKETYADPESAGRFFDQMVETRQKAIDQFGEELNGDERLSAAFARDPLGMLNERKLLGPLDQITVEGLLNPFVHWPWPWPICRVVCWPRIETHIHWVCVGIWPFRICWPVVHVHISWVCRIVCD